MKKLRDAIIKDARYIRDHELQPGWFKIFKVFLLLGGAAAFYLIFGGKRTAIFLGCFFGLGLILHLVYRINTQEFTRSWLDFQVEEIDGKLKTRPIGPFYYLAILTNFILSFLASYIFSN